MWEQLVSSANLCYDIVTIVTHEGKGKMDKAGAMPAGLFCPCKSENESLYAKEETMGFKLVRGGTAVSFLIEKDAFEGVRMVAEKVCADIKLVSGKKPKIFVQKRTRKPAGRVVVATVGNSPLLDLYEKEGLLDLSKVRGKREVYQIKVLGEGSKAVLVIAGSDKRGTIYGLFRLSECIGVSPLVYWADVAPARCREPELSDSQMITSKEPSVKYRGFFINDEWPSFGGWTMEKFGGFTAEMYDKVFELLLRMKGNYLWPAMWSSSFPLDGPGLASAELADKYGVVMGTSHHEPCLRASEEWDKVKGPESKYGCEWNYYTNRQGLLNYWEDGLKRSGKFENIITVGMRGERDSSMLGPDATLGENIDLLKDIITNQRKLIAKYVNEDTAQVPQMLALYKEVEAYYYGDADTPGLKDWEGLDGVTLMLCEDNFGNMRTLPTKELREHPGGFGMYYHFDYHGGPVSYEWVNSTPITKVWEQMSQAYDYGIRDIWIVNVGDLKPQEFPLSFFLDLAYDFDKYGTNAPNKTKAYTDNFVKKQFGQFFGKEKLADISYILEEYTRQNGIRRPEVMGANVYHPVHYGEMDRLSKRAVMLMKKAEELYALCPKEGRAAFCELVYFPAAASANVILMQIAAAKNQFYARSGMVIANSYEAEIEKAIVRDGKLIEEYHKAAGGKWNHMMSSAHIGFVSWNDEGWRYPVAAHVFPVNGMRIGLRLAGEERIWLGGTQQVKVSRSGGKVRMELLNGGSQRVSYEVTAEGECSAEKANGEYEQREWITVAIAGGEAGKVGTIHIQAGNARFEIKIERVAPLLVKVQKDRLGEIKRSVQGCGEYLVLDAGDFSENRSYAAASYKLLENYGRTGNSIKVYPTTVNFGEERARLHQTPEVEYVFEAGQEGQYGAVVYVSPTNPLYPGDAQRLAVTANDGETQVFSTLPDGFIAGNCWNAQWNDNVLNNIRECKINLTLKAGENRLVIGAVDAGVVVQKIVVYPADKPPKKSYLGPEE